MQPNLGLDLHRFLFEQMSDETIVAIQDDIIDTFAFWLPFVDIKDIKATSVNNTLTVYVEFNLNKDPNTLESVEVTIGE